MDWTTICASVALVMLALECIRLQYRLNKIEAVVIALAQTNPHFTVTIEEEG